MAFGIQSNGTERRHEPTRKIASIGAAGLMHGTRHGDVCAIVGEHAAQNSALNTRGTFIAQVTYVIAVSLSLLFGWGLVGIAASLFLSRIAELVAKIVPVFRSMASVPRCSVPPEIRRRMFTFYGFSTWLMLLQIVVWGPSDIVLLKLLQPDIRQVTFSLSVSAWRTSL
jgi:hypothetical protein